MVTNQHILCDNKGNILLKTYHSKVSVGKRTYREHHHTECELSLFVSGNGVYTVDNKSYIFSKGDVFLFGSNESHCITEIHSGLDLLNIHFEPRLLWEHSDNIELLSLFFSRNNNFENIFCNVSFLQNNILNIEQELINKDVGYFTEVKHILFSALIYILRNYNYVNETERSQKHYQIAKKMKHIIDYIDENLDQKIRLSQIADMACMSENYFSSVFKKLNGISPWDYITIKRVEKAIALIKTSDLSKLEIAEMCGFSSSSNFYKMFSKVTGKTPSDYIK